MKTMTVADFKSHFSEVIDQVKTGEKIKVTYGKTKEVIGYFIAQIPQNHPKRELGLLSGKANVNFNSDFELSEDDFLNL